MLPQTAGVCGLPKGSRRLDSGVVHSAEVKEHFWAKEGHMQEE